MLSQVLVAAALQLPVHDLSPGAELALELKTDQVELAGGTIRELGLFADRVVEVSTFPDTGSVVGQPSSAGVLLRGVERSTGVVIWEQPVLFGSVATPPELETFAAAAASPAGNLFVVSGRADGDNLLAAFDAQTGARQWVIDTDTVPELTSFGSSALFILAVDPTGSTVVGAGVSGLAAFDASTGQVLWARTGFDLAQALPSAVSSLLGFGDLEVGSQSVYLTGTAGLPLVAALDLATGVASFDRALLGNNAGTLRLDATEQHLAVASVDFNIFFGGTLQTFINVVDASTGVTVAATNFVQGAGELQWDSAGTELYGIQLTDSSQGQQLIQNASVWALDVLQNQVLYNELVAPNFGVDRVASARLRVGPQGELLVAAAVPQPDLVPVTQAGVELLAIDSATGAAIGSLPIDGGLVEAPQPLMAFEADANGSAVGAVFRDTQVGSGAVRTTNVDALGNVTWTSNAEAEGSTQQSVLRVAGSPDGSTLYVSELLGTGVQVRALAAQDGTELWRTQFAERAIFTSGQFAFGGDLVATADGSRLGLVFQAFGPSQPGLVEGVFVTLDAATGAVQWQNLVPQLHIGAASGMDQRTVLLHDAAADRWLLAGGSGEDVVRAFDAAGNPLWSQELPTPAAGPDTIFDGIAEFALAPAAGAVVVASSYLDASGPSNEFDPQLTAYRLSDGQLLWSTPLADDRAPLGDYEKVAGFSIDESVGQAVVAFSRGGGQTFAVSSRVVGVNLATGAPLWLADLPDLPNELVQTRRVEHLLDGQLAVVGGSPRANGGTLGINLVAYDTLGAEAWEFTLATDDPFEVIDLLPLAGGTALGVVTGPPRNGFGIPSTYDELGARVFVLDATDGALLWEDSWSYPWGGPNDDGNLRFTQSVQIGEQLFIGGYGRLVDDAAGNDFYLSVYELPELTADIDTIDLSDGGQQNLELRAGPDFGGNLFLTLGSISGQAGIPLGGGLVLPLTFDAWTQTTLANPNGGALVNSFSFLDANGRASGAIAVAPGSNPNLAGITATYAFLTIDPLTLAIESASNAVSHLLVP